MVPKQSADTSPSGVLRVAGVLSLLAGILPFSDGAGGVLGWDQIFGEPGATWALLAPFAAGLSWLLLSSARVNSLVRCTLSALTLLALAIGLTAHPETRTLLPYFPASMNAGAFWFFTLLVTVRVAATWQDHARLAKLLTFVGLASLGFLYLWPHASGTLVEALGQGALTTLDPELPFRERATVVLLSVLSHWPIVAAAVAAARILLGRDTRSAEWLFVFPPLMILSFAAKAASTLGDDALMLAGLRAAALTLCALLIGASALNETLAHMFAPHSGARRTPLLRDELIFDALRTRHPVRALEHLCARYRPWVHQLSVLRLRQLTEQHRGDPRAIDRIRCRLAGASEQDADLLSHEELDERRNARPRAEPWAHFLARGRRVEMLTAFSTLAIVGGLALGAEPPVRTADEHPLKSAPAWAIDLYENALPNIAVAAGRVDRGAAPHVLDRAIERAMQRAEPEPRIRDVLARMKPRLVDPAKQRRVLRRLADELNLEARQLGWPLYLDLNIRRMPEPDGPWTLWVGTYRIREVRRAYEREAGYTAYWLERLDHLNVLEDRLGWKKVRQRHAMVMLDVVRRHWHDDLLPALAGGGGQSLALYRRVRSGLTHDLATELDRVWAGRADLQPSKLLRETIACQQRWGRRLSPHHPEPVPDDARDCWDKSRTLAPLVVDVLAKKVEAHEFQHVIDDRSLEPPRSVLELMKRRNGQVDRVELASAVSEVSAYLAEITRSEQPRLALTHLFVLADQMGGAESVAGHVVFEAMRRGEEQPVDVIALPSDEIHRRAHDAYRSLFGKVAPYLDVQRATIERDASSEERAEL